MTTATKQNKSKKKKKKWLGLCLHGNHASSPYAQPSLLLQCQCVCVCACVWTLSQSRNVELHGTPLTDAHDSLLVKWGEHINVFEWLISIRRTCAGMRVCYHMYKNRLHVHVSTALPGSGKRWRTDWVETQMRWIMQLHSDCCGGEGDNGFDEDTLRWKPRVKQTEEKNIMEGKGLSEWLAGTE